MDEILDIQGQETNPNKLSSLFLLGGVVAVGVLLSQFAFTHKSREIIVRRAGGRCEQEDGTCVGGLEASHIDHTRNEFYNNPENGILLCSLHHLAYHLAHRRNPKAIGLSKQHNEYAIRSLKDRVAGAGQ